MRILSVVHSEWFNGSSIFFCRGVINKQGYQCQGMLESTYKYYTSFRNPLLRIFWSFSCGIKFNYNYPEVILRACLKAKLSHKPWTCTCWRKCLKWWWNGKVALWWLTHTIFDGLLLLIHWLSQSEWVPFKLTGVCLIGHLWCFFPKKKAIFLSLLSMNYNKTRWLPLFWYTNGSYWSGPRCWKAGKCYPLGKLITIQ